MCATSYLLGIAKLNKFHLIAVQTAILSNDFVFFLFCIWWGIHHTTLSFCRFNFFYRVQIFWEGHKFFKKSSNHLWHESSKIHNHYSLFRHFVDAVEFMDNAVSNNGKVFVNCVYGKSRSTSFVVVYLMLCHDWTALDALRHIRKKRPVQLNPGFLLQIVDLDYKLKWQRVSIA